MSLKKYPFNSQEYDIFQCPLCNSIPEKERDSFVSDVRYRLKKYNKKDIILMQGMEYNELHILIDGETKSEMTDEKGDFFHIEFIKAPNALAVAFLFAHKNFSPVTVIANSECRIITIPKENIFFLMRKYEIFLMEFLNHISNKVDFLSEKLRMVSLRTIKAKLAYYLIKESVNENTFILKKSKEDISHILGVSRPALVTVMMQMASEGFIDVDGRKITILDRASLRNLI